MKAMILAAGYGTRFRPVTNIRPKCLMPVANRPLLGLWLGRLAAANITGAVINTHHLAEEVRLWLAHHRPAVMEVALSHEPGIMGTGGALVQARAMLGKKPFLLLNADVLCTASFAPLIRSQESTGALAVLGLVDDKRFNTVAVSPGGRVLGFKGDPGIPADALWRTYSGLAVITPELIGLLPQEGGSSLIQGFRAALAGAANGGAPLAGVGLDGYWNDLGEPGRYLQAHRLLAQDPPPHLKHLAPAAPILVAKRARIHPGATVSGFAFLSKDSRIEDGAAVKDSVLLPGAVVKGGATVNGAVLGDGFVASGVIKGGAHA